MFYHIYRWAGFYVAYLVLPRVPVFPCSAARQSLFIVTGEVLDTRALDPSAYDIERELRHCHSRLLVPKLREYALDKGYGWMDATPNMTKWFEVEFHTKNIWEEKLPWKPNWFKIDALFAAMNHPSSRGFDWLMWVDSDVLIMETDVRLDCILQHANPNHLIILQRELSTFFNSGFFFIRNTDAGRAFLEPWRQKRVRFYKDQRALNTICNSAALAARYPDDKELARSAHAGQGPECPFLWALPDRTLFSESNYYFYGDFSIHFLSLDRPEKCRCVTQLLKTGGLIRGPLSSWVGMDCTSLSNSC
eukprot:g13252.t1